MTKVSYNASERTPLYRNLKVLESMIETIPQKDLTLKKVGHELIEEEAKFNAIAGQAIHTQADNYITSTYTDAVHKTSHMWPRRRNTLYNKRITHLGALLGDDLDHLKHKGYLNPNNFLTTFVETGVVIGGLVEAVTQDGSGLWVGPIGGLAFGIFFTAIDYVLHKQYNKHNTKRANFLDSKIEDYFYFKKTKKKERTMHSTDDGDIVAY